MQGALGQGYLSAFPAEHFDRLQSLQPVWVRLLVVCCVLCCVLWFVCAAAPPPTPLSTLT